MDNQLFSSVDFWALRESTFRNFGNAAFGIAGGFSLRDPQDLQLVSPTAIAYNNSKSSKPGPNGYIAIVTLDEVVTRYLTYYTYGSEVIAAWIMQVADDEDVAALVIKSDCYGGDANGIELVETAVKYCKSKKPVVSLVANAYSGGMWIIAHSSHIMMESKTISGIGSIGVYSTHIDYVDMLQKKGINYEMIRAKGSENKALNNMVEKLTDEARAKIVERVSKIRTAFIKTVKSGRKNVDDAVFDGSEFNGEDAIKVGLADSIGLLGDAIELANSLVK